MRKAEIIAVSILILCIMSSCGPRDRYQRIASSCVIELESKDEMSHREFLSMNPTDAYGVCPYINGPNSRTRLVILGDVDGRCKNPNLKYSTAIKVTQTTLEGASAEYAACAPNNPAGTGPKISRQSYLWKLEDKRQSALDQLFKIRLAIQKSGLPITRFSTSGAVICIEVSSIDGKTARDLLANLDVPLPKFEETKVNEAECLKEVHQN